MLKDDMELILKKEIDSTMKYYMIASGDAMAAGFKKGAEWMLKRTQILIAALDRMKYDDLINPTTTLKRALEDFYGVRREGEEEDREFY